VSPPRLALLAFSLFAAASPVGAADPMQVVITTDCGADVDDQWAIVHAALSPRLRVLAVIGGFAPEPHGLGSADTARCAREALAAVGREASVPVLEGAGGPLPDRSTPVRGEGVDRLLRLSAGSAPGRRLAVLGLGPMTDLASALLLDPGVADRVEVVALAFEGYPEGGDGWNGRNDPAAWRVLLDSGVLVTVASGGIARERLALRRGEPDAMLGRLGAGGAYLACLHAAWLDEVGDAFVAAEVGADGRWPVWDEAVVAMALGAATAREVPRPALRDDLSFAFPNGTSAAPFRWVDSIDRERLFGDLAALLATAASPSRAAAVGRGW
jgi:inosine-uridine nucleoside N-ribohydrolase